MSSSHRHSRRDSPPSRYRRDSFSRRDSPRRDSPRRDSRRSSPGPSRGRGSPPSLSRSEKSLPEQFGRIVDRREEEDDNTTVLQCMKKSFNHNPLGSLTKVIGSAQKLKVWTRNYKEVRGICTGYVVAFDKHWNLILKDVHEVYLRPRKNKTPYLSELKSGDEIPEIAPKVPKVKPSSKEGDVQPPVSNVEAPSATEAVEGGKKKKKRKRKKKNTDAENRCVKQCFIRGDNIVMVAIVDDEENET